MENVRWLTPDNGQGRRRQLARARRVNGGSHHKTLILRMTSRSAQFSLFVFCALSGGLAQLVER